MDLIASAKNWLNQDPDPLTRLELEQLIDAQDQQGLRSRFETRLQFGTAESNSRVLIPAAAKISAESWAKTSEFTRPS